MKLLYYPLAIALIVGATYQVSPSARAKIRRFGLSEKDLDRYNAYHEGLAMFRQRWTGDRDAKFTVWGDDARVGAEPLQNDFWMASGRVAYTLIGTPVNHPWLIVFNRPKGEYLMHSVGGDTDQTIAAIQRGDSQKIIANKNASPGARKLAAATPAPKPGEWMWKGYKPALDPPAKH